MSAYASLLKQVPAMRFYDAVSKMAPKSGFAAKTKKVKDMVARKNAAASKVSTAAKKASGATAAAKTIKKRKPTAAPKTAVRAKTTMVTRERRSGSARRSLVNI